MVRVSWCLLIVAVAPVVVREGQRKCLWPAASVWLLGESQSGLRAGCILQILCARLKILAQPHVRVGRLPPRAAAPAPTAAPPQQQQQQQEGNAEPDEAAPAAAADEQQQQQGEQQEQQQRQERQRRQRARREAALAAGDGGFVPNVLRCTWDWDPAQAALLPRLRANVKVMLTVALVVGVAAFNALAMPLALEGTVLRSPR